MAKKDIISLSEFIKELKREIKFRKHDGEESPKTESLIPQLETMLRVKGDFEFDLNDMKRHLGI